MEKVTFTSTKEPKSIYEIEHNLDSDQVIVDVKVLKENGWWTWPVAVHHLDNNRLVIDVIHPMHVKVVMFIV